ncbi:MAG: 50S ribosomal protein L13 [bacterium]
MPEHKTIEASRRWHCFDAADKVLGRLSTQIAVLLMGKHKREFAHSIDVGDFVVVTNTGKLRLTGRKEEQKNYFRHSGYAKGAKLVSFRQQMEKDPTRVLTLAVKRMLGVNRLRARRLKRLRVFPGPEHAFKNRFPETATKK